MKHQFINRKDGKFIYIHHHRHMVDESQVDYYNNPSNWIFYNIPMSSKIESGSLTILGKRWYYCNRIQHFPGNCAVFRDIARFTVDHDVFIVRYAKALPSYDCSDWKNEKMLTAQQRDLWQS